MSDVPKEQLELRAEIERQVQKFLSKGGKITVVPPTEYKQVKLTKHDREVLCAATDEQRRRR